MCHRASRATVLRACSHARGIKRHADAQNRWRKTSSTFFCTRRCRLRCSRSKNHPFPRSRFRPMITQSLISFFICLSVRRISLANRAPPLYSHPREPCIDRATRKSNSTKCILTAVVDPNCAKDIVSVACVIKSEDFDCLLVVLFCASSCAYFRPETQRSVVSKREKYHPKFVCFA